MAKKKGSAYMSGGEKIAGLIFFAVYLLLPLVTAPLFRVAGNLLGVTIRPALQNLIYYYVLFGVTVVIFHSFLGRTCRNLADNLGPAAKYLGAGLVALYGLNELAFRLTNLAVRHSLNLNDTAISAQIQGAPRTTFLIVVLLAPFIEEVLFRGLVFGNLRAKSSWVAYLVSAMLFALLHVWQFAVVQQDLAGFVVLLQYLVPGLVLAWCYDRTGTLWTAIGVHAAANALAVWTVH